MAGLPRLRGHLASTDHTAKPRATKTNPKARSDKVDTAARKLPDEVTLAVEAKILTLLSTLNAAIINSELPTTIQAVKAALYERDYAKAFGNEVSLADYTDCVGTSLANY